MDKGVKRRDTTSKSTNVCRCLVCERVLANKSSLNVHMKIHTGHRPHKCATCDKAFFQKTHLIAHMKTHNKQNAQGGSQVNNQFSCRVCGKSFKTYRGRNSHMRSHKAVKALNLKSTDKLFKCKFCGKVFPTFRGRNKHIRLHMTEVGPQDQHTSFSASKNTKQKETYKCNQCGRAFRSYVDLKQHRDTHAKLQPTGSLKDTVQEVYRCFMCDRTFRSYVYLKLHTDTHRLMNQVNKVHVKQDTPSLYKTEPTTVGESSGLNLETPVSEEPESTGCKYVCHICRQTFEAVFYLKQHLQTHVINLESGEKYEAKPHVCSICGKRFLRAYDLQHHLNIHARGGYKCSLCEKVFSFQSWLKRHLKRAHDSIPSQTSSKRQHQCKICRQAFSKKVHMLNHMKFSHKVRTPQQTSSTCNQGESVLESACLDKSRGSDIQNGILKQGTSTQSYPCPECDKTFTNWNKLFQHKRSAHKKLKINHCCSICNKRFSSQNVLRKHVKQHGLCMRHQCQWCERSYTMKNNLCRHVRLAHGKHSNTVIPGAKQDVPSIVKSRLQCSICKKTFTRRDVLMRHVRHHCSVLRFQCRLCAKSFTEQSSRQRHMKVAHTTAINDSASADESGESDKDLEALKCPVCKRMFSRPEQLRKHVQLHRFPQRYDCQVCKKSYSNVYNLQRHMKTAHPTMKNYTASALVMNSDEDLEALRCPVCKRMFNRPDNLRKHLKQHSSPQRHECQVCGRVYSQVYNLYRHIRIIHTKLSSARHQDSVHQCPVCDQVFSRKDVLYRHMRRHNKSSFPCQVCGKDFTRQSDLCCHERTAHKNSKIQHKSHLDLSREAPEMMMAHSTTKAQQKTSKHLRTKHNIQSKKGCHVRKGEPNKCSVCGKGFSNWYCYKLHLRMHTGEKPHSCNICGKLFSYAHQIYHHKRSQHPGTPDNINIEAEDNGSSPKLAKNEESSIKVESSYDPRCSKKARSGKRCLLCKKWFSNQSGLSSHMRVHVKTKPHDCFCGKSFTNPFNLKRHKLSHVNGSEGDLFVCSGCGTTFKTSNDLLAHIKVKHYKLYPSKKSLKSKIKRSQAARLCRCGKCNKTFHFTFELNSHVKRHTGETSFSCPCGEHFSFRHHLKKHITYHLNPQSRLYIKGFEQDNVTFLKQFKKTEQTQYRCKTCYRVFTDKHHFKLHAWRHLNRRKTMFSTSFCTDGGGGGQKFFNCILCDEKFSSKVKQTYHLKCHTNPKSKLCVTQVQPKLLQKQLRILDNKQRYRCRICKTEFDSQTACRRHLQTHSTTHSLKQIKDGAIVSGEPLLCVFCDRKFSILSRLIIHVRTHTGIKPYQCDMCEKKFSLPYTLKGHLKKVHGGQNQESQYKSHGTGTSNQRQDNTNTPLSNQHQCKICQRVFALPSSLKIHMSKKHIVSFKIGSVSSTSSKQNIAKKFPHGSASSALYKDHNPTSSAIYKDHNLTSSAIYKDHNLTSSAIYNDHKLTANDKHYPCTFCKKSYPRMEDVLKHYVSCSESSGKGPYLCPLCNKPEVTPSMLYSHFQKHSPEKQFKCRISTCSYKRKGDMAYHMRKLHPGEQPDCGSKRSARSASRPECSVERIRERAKAFPKKDVAECVVCDKTFKQELAFNVHMRIHTGELPYRCDVCGKRFMLLSNKIVHVKLLHRDEDAAAGRQGRVGRKVNRSPDKMLMRVVPDDAAIQEGGSEQDKTEEDVWEEVVRGDGESDYCGEEPDTDTMLIDGHMIYMDHASPVDDEESMASDDELQSQIEVENISVETGMDGESKVGSGSMNVVVSEGTVFQGLGLEQNEVQGHVNAIFGDHLAVADGYDCAIQSQSDHKQCLVDDMQGQADGMQGQADGMQGQADGMQGQVDHMQGQVDDMQGQVHGMQGQHDGVQGQGDGMQGQVDGMKAQVDRMQGQADGMQSQSEFPLHLGIIAEVQCEELLKVDGVSNNHSVYTGPIVDGPGRDLSSGGPAQDLSSGGAEQVLSSGGPGQDLSSGGPAQDLSSGGPGQDLSSGGPAQYLSSDGPGQDLSSDGPGQDLSSGGPSQDLSSGGPSQDLSSDGPGQDLSSGGPRQDLSSGGPVQDLSSGGPGQDLSSGGPGQDLSSGGPRQDLSSGGPGQDLSSDGRGQDLSSGGPAQDLSSGGPGQDLSSGGPAQDLSSGGPGQDLSSDGPAQDLSSGGPGQDLSSGGPAQDLSSGGPGQDLSSGGPAQDLSSGGPEQDLSSDGPGQDLSSGGPGQDLSSGGPAQDLSSGGPAQDLSSGGPEQDLSSGGPEQDLSSGGPEQDLSSGGPEQDLSSDGPGQDLSSGGPEQDLSSGGPEQDLSSGGPGQDLSSGGPEQDLSSGVDDVALVPQDLSHGHCGIQLDISLGLRNNDGVSTVGCDVPLDPHGNDGVSLGQHGISHDGKKQQSDRPSTTAREVVNSVEVNNNYPDSEFRIEFTSH
ncbi:uncharacterized protein LOC124151881 [Haliotis rufescens]|uniref:uncharacterized protein LOC124151881 n=1 Tax=Haliotis rufescens TaxID=6454 RepID=UPI00201FB000|nr:uncharacterized protein LOC124151881 [Haliotis rufescens]XP_046380517.2 uncharacterized protein LOC124151881 [Haliotis rufescens]XP_046380518.2 uncharacterized protein LOC124151881 [Haliotis rufescens]XP_046380519.2 uncharacterized protein LOC124151881 [Haliotis rufescens]